MTISLRLFGVITLTSLLLMGFSVSTAYAHGGVEPDQNILPAWDLESGIIIGLVFIGALYTIGLRRWHRPSHPG